MKYLDPHDQASETLVYHSAVIAQQQQAGLLSRPEAEVLDILHKMFSQERQEDAVAHRSATPDDLCVVLVRSGGAENRHQSVAQEFVNNSVMGKDTLAQ